MKAHMNHLGEGIERLRQSGELVEVMGLTWPSHAKVVRAASVSAPVLTDGPYAESKEVLAGYTMIDVESEERAYEIAAWQSAAPGPGGVPLEQPIEVRRVMESVFHFLKKSCALSLTSAVRRFAPRAAASFASASTSIVPAPCPATAGWT